jgi:hypothetical protein
VVTAFGLGGLVMIKPRHPSESLRLGLRIFPFVTLRGVSNGKPLPVLRLKQHPEPSDQLVRHTFDPGAPGGGGPLCPKLPGHKLSRGSGPRQA